MFGPYAIPYIDALYFWSDNVDHRVGRAMMRRNFSNLSVGVLQQVCGAVCVWCGVRVRVVRCEPCQHF
jgi:hypothetical protein